MSDMWRVIIGVASILTWVAVLSWWARPREFRHAHKASSASKFTVDKAPTRK